MARVRRRPGEPSLPRVLLVQSLADSLQGAGLVCREHRGEQGWRLGVTDQPVDLHVGRQVLEKGDQAEDVALEVRWRIQAAAMKVGQLGASEHVAIVQLHRVDTHCCQEASRFPCILARFRGQSVDRAARGCG